MSQQNNYNNGNNKGNYNQGQQGGYQQNRQQGNQYGGQQNRNGQQNNNPNRNNQQSNNNREESNENQENQRKYDGVEIYSFANKNVLIAFNNLMKNLTIIKDPAERKDMAKKNKIQVCYLDLSQRVDGKHPKHDFFVDPEEMKYFVDMTYEALMNPGVKNNVRMNGHKFMGGFKTPPVSNIIDFTFLTEQEYKDSPNNKKIFDKSKENPNVPIDWKNLQVAKINFDKQHGRIINGGLIVPTGKKIDNTNFKTYYISTKSLLEMCVTMRDAINLTEQMFAMEDKMHKFQESLTTYLDSKFAKLFQTPVSNFVESSPKVESVPQAPYNTANITENNQQRANEQQSNNNTVQNNNHNQNNNALPDSQQRILNEAKSLIEQANPLFLQTAKDKSMGIFLNCLVVNKTEYQRDSNTLQIDIKFDSTMYRIEDYANCVKFYNDYYQFTLQKVAKEKGQQYTVQVNQLS